jgi:hypothetical protein
VLHVEQEVVGDDTPALESVLQCDTLREELLRREREISVSINKGYVFVQKVNWNIHLTCLICFENLSYIHLCVESFCFPHVFPSSLPYDF